MTHTSDPGVAPAPPSVPLSLQSDSLSPTMSRRWIWHRPGAPVWSRHLRQCPGSTSPRHLGPRSADGGARRGAEPTPAAAVRQSTPSRCWSQSTPCYSTLKYRLLRCSRAAWRSSWRRSWRMAAARSGSAGSVCSWRCWPAIRGSRSSWWTRSCRLPAWRRRWWWRCTISQRQTDGPERVQVFQPEPDQL